MWISFEFESEVYSLLVFAEFIYRIYFLEMKETENQQLLIERQELAEDTQTLVESKQELV